MSSPEGTKQIATVKKLTEFAETGRFPPLLLSPFPLFSPTFHPAELQCKVSHLALAWVARNPNTSTVILGTSKPEQVLDNLKALEVLPKLTPEVLEKIEKILGNKPAPWVRLSF